MGFLNSIFGSQRTDGPQRETLAAHGFSPCPTRRADIERRFNDLSSTTGQGGYTIRDPYCAETAGRSAFFFVGVPPPRGASGAGPARPKPAFMVPFSTAKGRAQIWLTNSAIEANPMLAKRIRLALSALNYETPGSALVPLTIPPAWIARHVIGAIGEPGRTLDALLGEKTADVFVEAGEHGFFCALFRDGWMGLETFTYGQAFSAPHGSLHEQCAFAKNLAGR